jgi:phenylpropionate dioxygenase-like ring-hydroxylating dioxygenase large terminal subunit
MNTDAASPSADPASLVRPGAVHRAVYRDRAIFALEQERIFRRVWLYVGHESEVPAPGDYLVTRLGADQVVLVRQADGTLALLHNRCAHRGARVVVAQRGNAKLFRCPYHSWAYRNDGSLIGVPDRDGYGPAFDPGDPKLGLRPVARVASYRGFVFGCHAPTGAGGPDLPTYLGGLASAIDNLVDRAPAGQVSRFGGRLQMEYAGNWKLFMENAVDLVHPGFVHASSVDAARAEPAAAGADAISAQAAQMFLANGLGIPNWDRLPVHGFPRGHVYMGGFYRDGVIAPERADPVFERYRAALVERHGEAKTAAILAVDRFNNLVWPNVSINARFQVMRVLTPIAVDRTIVTAYCFRLEGAPDEMGQLSLRFLNTAASPASMVASDDLEIFERCQHGFSDAGSDWLDISRGLARDRHGAAGESHAPGTSELPIRTQLAAWQAYMAQP